MDTTINTLMTELIEAINNHAQPIWFDVLLVAITILSTAFSISLTFMIYKRQTLISDKQTQIMEEQNKIALFDKRYKLYILIKEISHNREININDCLLTVRRKMLSIEKRMFKKKEVDKELFQLLENKIFEYYYPQLEMITLLFNAEIASEYDKILKAYNMIIFYLEMYEDYMEKRPNEFPINYEYLSELGYDDKNFREHLKVYIESTSSINTLLDKIILYIDFI